MGGQRMAAPACDSPMLFSSCPEFVGGQKTTAVPTYGMISQNLRQSEATDR